VLLDTGPWLALFHGADRQHARAVAWLQREGSGIRLVSTWPVLTEVAFFLRAGTKQRVLEWVDRGAVELVDLSARDRAAMHASIGRFADQRPDLADASLLAVAERLGIAEVATFDRKDFSTYRIGRDVALALTDFEAAPPARRRRKR
jgi:predicted nucleic acid-binding protein